MDAMQVMLLSLMIGASVSAGGTDGVLPKSTTAQQQAAPAPTMSLSQPLGTSQPTQTQAASQLITMPPAGSGAPQLTFVTPAQTPAPTPTATKAASSGSSSGSSSSQSSTINRELAMGSRGNDVRMLQQLLQGLGYSVSVDGAFGKKTQDAVSAFQKNNGLKADGIAGSRTIRKLTADGAIGADGGENRTSLSYGMSGQDVRDLQTRLSQLGYYHDVISGNYLINTSAAVRWFQQVNGLSDDGIAGPATLTRLYGAQAIAAGASILATPLPTYALTPVPYIPSVTAPPGGVFYRTMKETMSGSDITYLQDLLRGLGYFGEASTGYYGTQTKAAVAAFQQANGLYSDGVAGTATQQVLLGGNAVTSPGGVYGGAQSTGLPCVYCNQTYNSGQAALHRLNAGCSHAICVSGTHRACIVCGQPECKVPLGLCTNGGQCTFQ